MNVKILVTFAISAIGLLATAVSGVLWIVNESAKYQDTERRATETRIVAQMTTSDAQIHERIATGFKFLANMFENNHNRAERRDNRIDARIKMLVEQTLDHKERILRLENPEQDVTR